MLHKKNIDLFISFFKISPITFGGGYSMISLIEREIVLKKQLITEQEMTEILTLAQIAPGAVAINSAILIGLRVSGLIGSFFSLLGIMLPNIIILAIAILLYSLFHDNELVKAAFHGIGAAVIGLILYAGYTMWKSNERKLISTIVSVLVLGILLITKINPIFLIAGGCVITLLLYQVHDSRNKRKKLM